MVSNEQTILNLVYRYAEMVDRGQFEQIGEELFAHCRFIVAAPPAPELNSQEMIDLLCRTTIRYEDGTPHTKHVVTNPIVEVDDLAGTASCRSYYTVFQQTPTLPFQPIVSGRYEDRFERVDGSWRFALRNYSLVDAVGNLSQHLRMDLRPSADVREGTP